MLLCIAKMPLLFAKRVYDTKSFWSFGCQAYSVLMLIEAVAYIALELLLHQIFSEILDGPNKIPPDFSHMRALRIHHVGMRVYPVN